MDHASFFSEATLIEIGVCDRICEVNNKYTPMKVARETADIWRRYHWFSRQMTSEKRAQKFHTDDASLSRSG